VNFTIRRGPGAGASIKLDHPDSFTEFSVLADPDLAPAELDAALDSLAESYDGTHVFIAQSTIRAAAGELGAKAGWNAALAQMVEFAQSHGWVDKSGNIRAHVQHL
jgi:predicted transcriptional regulator